MRTTDLKSVFSAPVLRAAAVAGKIIDDAFDAGEDRAEGEQQEERNEGAAPPVRRAVLLGALGRAA